MLAFYIHDESLPFDNVTLLTPGPSELHWDTGRLVHLHPHPTIPRCIPLQETLASLHIEIAVTAFAVGPVHGEHAGTYPLDGADRIHFRLAPHGAPWEEHALEDLLPATVPDGARLLMSYGQPSDADLERQQMTVPRVPSRYLPSA